MDATSQRRVSALPGILLGLCLLILTALAWPPILQNIFPLDWRIGDMRSTAQGFQLVFGCLTVTSLLVRRRISSLYFRAFPTRKKLIFAIVAVGLSLVVSLIMVEMGFRLLRFPFKEKEPVSENALAQFDPELGWCYIPNRSVVQEFGDEKREVAMHFDELGSRVRAPGVRHDPTAPTVLFVGCSYTMGHGLPYEETFVGRLESMPDFPFQVVNFGVQGYGTDQSLLLLKRHFKKFSTKVVVYTFNDQHPDRNRISDVRLFHRFNRFLGTKPLFALKPGGTVYLRKRPARYDAISYSRLWACIQIAMIRWGPKPGFDLTRALLHEMKDYVESNGATFIVMSWNQWSQQRPKSVAQDSPFWGMDLKVIDADANPPPGWNNWKIPGDGHPDARGHAYVARLLVEAFKNNMKKWQNAMTQ